MRVPALMGRTIPVFALLFPCFYLGVVALFALGVIAGAGHGNVGAEYGKVAGVMSWPWLALAERPGASDWMGLVVAVICAVQYLVFGYAADVLVGMIWKLMRQSPRH